ncbi:MAG: hypothetical protein U5P10_00035 [Spirochaetia bacterium]|nr:hypothetical protein [Spirochaetia bacterium]
MTDNTLSINNLTVDAYTIDGSLDKNYTTNESTNTQIGKINGTFNIDGGSISSVIYIDASEHYEFGKRRK